MTLLAATEPCRWADLPVRLPVLPEPLGSLFLQAALLWEGVCGFRFVLGSDAEADIYPRIVSPINRELLAWTDSPTPNHRRGQPLCIHLADTAQSYDLGLILAHEFGHAIGLPHLPAGSLMAPFYDAAIRTPQERDIAEARALYGAS